MLKKYNKSETPTNPIIAIANLAPQDLNKKV
jgi:hypothetical protein